MTEENGMMKCVFVSSDKLAAFLGNRHIRFVIGKNKAEGLKIPLKAIVEKNMIPIPTAYIVEEGHQKGVLKRIGESYQFAPIQVQYTDETHTYVIQQLDNAQTIQLGQVIQEPTTGETHTVSGIETVEGVYVINGSYAKFKKVTIAMTNEEYAILEKGQGTTVKEYDQIISNPQRIREDQLLKYMDIQNQ